jgi:hypothetical protein
VSGPIFCDGSEAPQSIGNDIIRHAQRFLHSLGNSIFGKFQLGLSNCEQHFPPNSAHIFHWYFK